MKTSRMLPGAIVVGSVAIASMFAAAPASAATLPPGQKITVIDQSDDQFYTVNPADALLSPVGTPITVIDEFESGVDVDDTGLGYAITYGYDVPSLASAKTQADAEFAASPNISVIYKADANTGLLSDGKQVVIDAGGEVPPPADECTSIDYTKGVILAVCNIYYDGSATAYIGTVDVSGEDALLTPLTTLDGEDFLYFMAIAINPLNGTVWGFEYTFSSPRVFTINLDDSYPSFVDYLDDYYVEAADFDRSGQLWLSVGPYTEITLTADSISVLELATFDFATSQPVAIAPFGSNDPYEISYPSSLTVWGALAATGSSMSIAPAIAASGILLLGALLAAGTMVLRRRNAAA